jgi:hypothetical protein
VILSFHYPNVERWKEKRGLVPYVDDSPYGTPALDRRSFNDVLFTVRDTKKGVLVSDPEILGSKSDFEDAREAVRKAGGRLFTVADTQEALVRGLFDDAGLRALAERVAAGRSVRVHPVSASPHERIDEHCAEPTADAVSLYLRNPPTPEQIARELVRVEMYEQGYPVLIGPGGADAWTDVLWALEIAHRLDRDGFDAAPLHDGDLPRHRESSIHSYAEEDLIAAGLLRTLHPTHLPEERAAFLERLRTRNPGAAERSDALVRATQGGERMRTPGDALRLFIEIGDLLEAWDVARFHVIVPRELEQAGGAS